MTVLRSAAGIEVAPNGSAETVSHASVVCREVLSSLMALDTETSEGHHDVRDSSCTIQLSVNRAIYRGIDDR